MGAETFREWAIGRNEKDAFAEVVADAQYQHGHGGYTGTIAEKHEFVLIGEVTSKEEAMDLAEKLIDKRDPRIDDKWGPAGCIKVNRIGPNRKWHFLFFGWASS